MDGIGESVSGRVCSDCIEGEREGKEWGKGGGGSHRQPSISLYVY